MTLIDDIKRDREAGTPGDWYVEYKHGLTHLIMPKHPDPCQMCDMTYYPWVPENLSDWKRIARVPQMEAALLAAEGCERVLTAMANRVSLYSGGHDDKLVNDAEEVLAAFRKTLGEDQ